jgi:hypothetical protein
VTVAPFEEPAKIEMRAGVEVAIDQAGFELVDPPDAIAVPEELAVKLALQGRPKGDLQSADGEGTRTCYYLRPRAEDALPEWLAKLATAAHSIPGVKLYVVVLEASPTFEKSCKIAGAGLLVLTEDREFSIILDFDSNLPEALDAELKEAITATRRDLETKRDLKLKELQGRFEKVGELTQGMASDVADPYITGVERLYKIWVEWSDGLSAQLDLVLADRDLSALGRIKEQIERGPTLDDDV